MLKQSPAFDIDRLSEAVNGLQKCLECTICLELMTAPVKTRCGHSFCQQCIGRVLQQNAPCPLCKEVLNKRSVSKDDHLESCIEKFKRLVIVIQTDSHIDVLSHLKLPRDTRESCSNSDSSQSSFSHKRKPTRRQSIRSNQSSTFKTDRPSTSWRTVIDCDNPRYDTNSLIQQSDPTSSSLAGLHPRFANENNNTFDDTSDVKVRTWIHSYIDQLDTIGENVEDETRSSEKNTSRVNKDTKKRGSNDTKKTDFDADKLKYNATHAKIRAKECRSADSRKSKVEEHIGDHRDVSATSNDQTRQTSADKSFFADTTWTRVKEIGKEMRGKKKKKLEVSTEKSTDRSTEKKVEEKTEKETEKNPGKSWNIPRIIEDVILTPGSKFESFNKSATSDNMINKEAKISNLPQKSSSRKQDAIDKKSVLSGKKITRKTSANEAKDRERSFASDKADSSMSEVNYYTEETSFITLADGDQKLRIKNLNSRQMNEIIGFKGDFQESTNDGNVLDRNRHFKEEEEKEDKEREENQRIMTESFNSSSSRQQRLIVLTPEKLNESVLKCRTTRDDGSRSPVSSRLADPMSCLPNRTPPVDNDVERTTSTISRREAAASESRSRMPEKPRLSLKRHPKSSESPLLSQVSLMERMSTDDFYARSSSGRKSIDSSVSKDGPSVERLASVRRDLSSQIISKECLQADPTAADVPDNRPQKDLDRGFPVKFTQLGTLIRRRNVRYIYLGAIKREQRLPARIAEANLVCNMQLLVSMNEIKYPNKLQSSRLESSVSTLQDSTGVTVLENVHYADKSIASPNDTVLDAMKLDIPASSTPKGGADRGRRLNRAGTTARGSSSTSANRPSVVQQTPASRVDQSTKQNRAHAVNSIKLLSPDKDSQLQFLSIDSPMSEHGRSRLASSTRPVQSELRRGGSSDFTKDNDLAGEVRKSQGAVNVPYSENSRFQPVMKRKRTKSDDDDDSSDSAVSVSSQRTVKFDKSKRKAHKSRDKTRSNVGGKWPSRDQVLCVDPDDRAEAQERKFKRIFSISDSDTESDSSARGARNRNKSGDRCDRGNASIRNTSTKSEPTREALDEDLRIRSIADKWNNEYGAAQKRSIEELRNAQDTVRPMRLASEKKTSFRRFPSTLTSTSRESDKRGSVKLNENTTTIDSDLFFESNSIFNSEVLEQLSARPSIGRSSHSRKSQSSMDPFNDDIISKVLQIDRSTGVASRVDGDETSQRDERNSLQDNFDEAFANVELPQSEDVIPCSELPAARRNPHRNLNRTLTEQNTSSCPAMTNEPARQMTAASSTADISGYCGKSAKKTQLNNTSENSDKENTHGQRKHDHAEEDRRDKKNITARRPDDKGREKVMSKNNVSQEKRVSFDRVAEATGRMSSRMEKEINVPASSASQLRVDDDDDGKAQGRSTSDDHESNAKDFSSASLMDITMQQYRLRIIEEDLFGVALTRPAAKPEKRNLPDDSFREEQRTPKKRKKGAHERSNAGSQQWE
ncbi:PREDICTED: uncharacterized protein LOC106743441 isoform X2 [Dinoponera quadriceps]|uniref:Uncharacterized protein LOC106743441 isoform X2 n=1 Tax=Dinoponera quadriceps TaxID=609295 RepID=A0A6P3X329_DINQU|nr:PREDICTED: uncharacterized protein LOC106743441 isoform X2 [Dinoponera quadriceps]